jgi:hypothetical protein
VADSVRLTGEVDVGRRRSRRLPAALWRRGMHERWPESKRGGSRVKLTEAWHSTMVLAPNAVTTAVDRASRGGGVKGGCVMSDCSRKGGATELVRRT